MTDHLRHPTHPPRPVRVALAAIKAAALGGLLALLVLATLGATRGSSSPVADVAGGPDPVVQRAMTSQQCSPQGFGAGTIPGSALVRTPAGKVRVVSFDRGWDVYQGRRAGTLIAVCLRDRPAR